MQRKMMKTAQVLQCLTSQVVCRLFTPVLCFQRGSLRFPGRSRLVVPCPTPPRSVPTAVPVPRPEVHAEAGDLMRRLQPSQRPSHDGRLPGPELHFTFYYEIWTVQSSYVISYTLLFQCCSLRLVLLLLTDRLTSRQDIVANANADKG